MKRVETIAGAVLYFGDCREILPELSAAAVVTSPPYDMQRKYGSSNPLDWKQNVCNALVKSPADSQILVNLGLVHREGRVKRYWDVLIGHMEANGWRLFGWYIWDQLSGMTGDWNGRLAPSFEFIFHFNKKSRVVNKTKRTLGGINHGPGIKNANGVAATKSHNGRPVQPFKIPDNVIRTVRDVATSNAPDGYIVDHPARFPIAFATELIEPFSSEGETIIDPFMGSGTTGVSALRLGRKFIGIEIEEKYFDMACRRIDVAARQADLFIKSPEDAVAATMPELLL